MLSVWPMYVDTELLVLITAAYFLTRGVNLGGRGDTSPQNLERGTPMYNVPQILTFSLYFSLT